MAASRIRSVTRHPKWDSTATTASNARSVLPRLISEFRTLLSEAASGAPTPQQLHQLRLEGKRLRYCLELFRGVGGTEFDGVIATLKSIQDDLGEISDRDATESLICSSGWESDPDGARLLDSIREGRTAAIDRFVSGLGKQSAATRLDGLRIEVLDE